MRLQAETNERQIFEKTEDLAGKIENFSKTLPGSEIYNLKERLNASIDNISDKLYKSFYGISRTERIRFAIRVFEALSDCRDYLTLAEKLRYGKTHDMVTKLDDILHLLYIDYPTAIKPPKAS